jgi:hypothetical protein
LHLGCKEDLNLLVGEECPNGVRHVGILPGEQLRSVLDTITRLPNRRIAWANSRPT